MVLAAVFMVIAVGILAPVTARPALVLAVVFGLASWIVGENFGQIFTGMSTDPAPGRYWCCSPPPTGRCGRRQPIRLPGHRRGSRPPRRSAAACRAGDRAPGGGARRAPASRRRGNPGQGGQFEEFDTVVIATHADQALRLLADPTPAEKQVLGAFGYTASGSDVPPHA